MLFEFDSLKEQKARIRVIGVGGAGSNAIDRMVNAQLTGVEFISVNTDAQALDHSMADVKIQIGKQITKGLGAGAQIDVGEAAAEEDAQAISAALDGSDMVFITAGMGGGTGTGAAPVVARIARELGALTIGIVTTPFRFEGPRRAKRGLSGCELLREFVDTLIIIPNQRLLDIVEKTTSMIEAFLEADSVLHQATRGISDLINVHGLINLDFADVKTVMQGMGDAIMGTGVASGEERAVMAAQSAIASPLLEETNIKGAQGLLVNITGGEEMSLAEVDEATNLIFEEVGEQANIIFGAVIDPELGDQMRVTVIATGFGQEKEISFAKEDEREEVRRPAPAVAKDPAPIPATPVTPVPPKIQEPAEPQEDLETPAYLRKTEQEEIDLDEPIIEDNDLDEPAYLRKKSFEEKADDDDVIIHFSDDLSVPTFIRRQDDNAL